MMMILLTSLILFGCEESMILKHKDVINLQIEENFSKNSKGIIKVSGLIMHSAMAVEKIEELADSKSKTLLITLVPTRKSLSGSFEYEVSVESNINVIYFGKEKIEIWKRE